MQKGMLIQTIARITRLNRIGIFTQIAITIAIMAVAMLALWIVSSSTFGKVQAALINVGNNKDQLNDITFTRLKLLEFRALYLQQLAGGNVGLHTTHIYECIVSLRLQNETLKQQLLDALEKVRAIAREPVSDANYERIKNLLMYMESQLLTVNTELQDAGSWGMMNTQTNVSRARTITGGILAVSLIVALFVGLFTAFLVSQPLRALVRGTEALARGDLSVNVEASGNKETTQVVKAFNKALGSLRNLVGEINTQADNLFRSSQAMAGAADQTGQAAGHMALAMQQLAQASVEQASQTSHVAEVAIKLSDLVRRVSDGIESIAESSSIVSRSAQQGQESTDLIYNKIESIHRAMSEANEVIIQLHQASAEIYQITTSIQAIAEQTSLLALNAEIEAARAGEHGRGFEVVAVQTGQLADRSKGAAVAIANLTNNMTRLMEQAVKNMEQALAEAEQGRALSAETKVTFGAIFEGLGNNAGEIIAIARSAKQMEQDNSNVVEALTSIAAISQENMANTEDITSTTEEQSASTVEVASLAKSLMEVAEGLRQAAAIFRTESA